MHYSINRGRNETRNYGLFLPLYAADAHQDFHMRIDAHGSAYAHHPHEPHGSATAWPTLVSISHTSSHLLFYFAHNLHHDQDDLGWWEQCVAIWKNEAAKRRGWVREQQHGERLADQAGHLDQKWDKIGRHDNKVVKNVISDLCTQLYVLQGWARGKPLKQFDQLGLC